MAQEILQATQALSSFSEYLDKQQQHTKQLLGTLLVQDIDPKYWTQALNDGKVTVATDESVAEKKGYFAIIFHTADEEICFEGTCDRVPQLISSYQTELTGILSVLYLICTLSSFTHNQITREQELLCDNLSAVHRMSIDTPPGIRLHLATDFDMINEIMKEKENRPEVKVSWVKAHQDGKEDLELLPLAAKLNVKANVDVNLFSANTPPYLTPAQAPTLFLLLKACLT
eukprot:1721008-Ditylum_brightwellii.AAC.1